MKFAKKDDVIKRKAFYKYEQINRKQKFLRENTLNSMSSNSSDLLATLSFFSQLKVKKSNKIKLVRRCVLNNRSRSVRKFRLSRIVLREYLSMGLMPGYSKCSW